MEKKRPRDDSSAAPRSKAFKFNAHTLRKLQAAVDENPVVDFVTKLPIDYSVRLKQMWKFSQIRLTKTIRGSKLTADISEGATKEGT
ncbi:hypothetical protein TSTA_101050 [Talaromyces stipitatus ATCC 10500]|uniref:Uncharacterized protein n=1 Tax=Talaromyces stipitatus (strain ATCC 10500 / CBS 375.48 / QM 6759 / NRRL 1006) TaxID=441959 RepID=B8MMW2_TALSN|nr:uncharacterized protein TSTA_101050 [Talaromyces stipitatus ATCC 10500]EED13865.1 hypothetical protein TSTA_101050 [Talaromyces stipitatus ATCC 10500]